MDIILNEKSIDGQFTKRAVHYSNLMIHINEWLQRISV